MSQKSKALKILNERRLALQENMSAFVNERNRLQRRLNIIIDHIELADVEMAAIDIQLTNLSKKDCFSVKIHIIHGEHITNKPRLMLEIIIKNHPPIFKLMSHFDVITYSNGNSPTDKMQLKSRLIEVVEEWLSTEPSITKLFSDGDEKLDDALENYLNDSSFERKIRRGAAFFPILPHD